MALKQIKLEVDELELGMYVSKLDRPWSQTPFPLQGFHIREHQDIWAIKNYCSHVYIDIQKGREPGDNVRATHTPVGMTRPPQEERRKRNLIAESAEEMQPTVEVAPVRVLHDRYPPVVPVRKEVKIAQQLHGRVLKAVGDVMAQLQMRGDPPYREAEVAATDMVASILRNPDAFSWLARVKEKDEHTYAHSVRSAVWGILFGRQLGLDQKELNTLALGLLLKDVGKVRLKKRLLTDVNRTPEDEEAYRRFVEEGVNILRDTPEVSPRVISIVKNHCERLNGSGFPQGLKGDKIPLLAKIAGIVTFYDEVTNPRGEAPLAPSKAVAELYKLRNIHFQEQLVLEFIRAVGLYPTGTLVELNTGEVGVVVEQNFERRLKPKVVVVMGADKQLLEKHRLLDLADEESRLRQEVESGRRSWNECSMHEIARDLEPLSYSVDVGAVRDDYMFKSASGGLMGWLGR